MLNFCHPSNINCHKVDNFLDNYMQVVVTIWTNVIITVLYSIINNCKPYIQNIVKNNFIKVFTCINLFGFAFAIVVLIGQNNDWLKVIETMTYLENSFVLFFYKYFSQLLIVLYFICSDSNQVCYSFVESIQQGIELNL